MYKKNSIVMYGVTTLWIQICTQDLRTYPIQITGSYQNDAFFW